MALKSIKEIEKQWRVYYQSGLLWFVTFAIWIHFWHFNPGSSSQENWYQWSNIAIFTQILPVLGIISSFLKKPLFLLSASLVSFFPIGLYFLGANYIYRYIGILNVLCFIYGIIIYKYKEKENREILNSTSHPV